jgi:hypothetical protein
LRRIRKSTRESNSGKHGTHGELLNRPLVHSLSVSWSGFGEVPFDSVVYASNHLQNRAVRCCRLSGALQGGVLQENSVKLALFCIMLSKSYCSEIVDQC